MPNETPKAPAPVEIIMSKLLETLHELPGVPIPPHTDKSLNTLVSSVLVKGVQEPITARIREDGDCEIIDGYRRFRAAQLAKRKEIPVRLIKADPEQARSLFYKLHGLPEPKKQTPASEKDAKSEASAAEKTPAQDEAKKAAEKPDTPKKPEAADAKTAAPATDKTADKKAVPPAEKAASTKPDKAAAKPEEKKPEAEKADSMAKPAEKKADTPATDKPAAEKPADKPKQAAPADKDKAAAKPAAYAEGPTGTTITKVLGEKLNPPDEKTLASLPLPKEGEAYAVTLHPAYLKKAEFNHFSVDRDSDDFKELFESIRMFGVKDPVLARPGKDGTLEILSGQRRHLIASELNYPVPTIIQRMDDDDAHILVADGNLHREKISTYDQARAIRMKIDSMKHKAGRRKKGETARLNTDEIIAKDMGISVPKLNRLARLAEATREVCDKIDDGTLTLSVASAMSFLTPKHQEQVIGLMDLGYKVNNDRIERMKKVEKSGKLTEKAMRDILDDKDIEPKAPPVQPTPAPAPSTPAATVPTAAASAPTPSAPTTPSMAPAPSSIPKSPDVAAPVTPVVPFSAIAAQNNAGTNAPAKPAVADPFVGKQERPESTKVILSGDRLRKYFPDVNMTPREIEDKVYEAIDFYQKYQEKQKQKAAIFDKGKGGSAR